MLTLVLTNFVFLSHISYIILERKKEFYRSTEFWMLLDGLLLSIYITNWYMAMPISSQYLYW